MGSGSERLSAEAPIRMGRSKATPICPYVFHLYQAHKLLFPTEKKEYWIKEALLKHNVESEEEEDPKSPEDPEEEESSDDSECESLTFGEIRESQGAGSKQAEKPTPTGRIGAELPNHSPRLQGDPGEGALTGGSYPSPMPEAWKCPTGWTIGGGQRPPITEEGG